MHSSKLRPVAASTGASPTVEQDLEPPCSRDIPPLVPDGEYEVVFVRAEETMLWGQKKAFLYFRIIQAGASVGQLLFMAVTFPSHGRFALSSKYLQQWSLAAGRQPSRRDRLSTRVFRDQVFLAKVRTVTRNRDGADRPPSARYSVIDTLLEARTGRICS